jgi:cytochrome P450
MDDGGAHPTSRCVAKCARSAHSTHSRLVVQEADISMLPFLQAIVKDIFRLHPATPLSIPRVSAERKSRYVGTRFQPAPASPLTCLRSTATLPFTTNPNDFVPDGFLQHPEVMATTGNAFYELVPFGVGRTMCPGYALGNMMVHLILAHILHGFEWSMPPCEDPPVFSATVPRKHPLHLVGKPKSAASLY